MTRSSLPGKCIALLVVVLALGLPRALLAANPFPDWVTQAAAVKLPSYPPNTPAVVVLDDRLIMVTPDGQTEGGTDE